VVGRGEEHVGEQLVVDPGTDRTEGLEVVVGHAVVALGERPSGVREPVELEVVVGLDKPASPGQALEDRVQRPRLLDCAQPERGHDVDRHSGQDADAAEAEACDLEQVGALVGRGLDDVTLRGHDAHPDDL
jgi:hypothetical protein